MSVQAMVWVFTHSQSTMSTRLVALAIADAANAAGENSYQSVETIARMARVSESTVHRAITWLVNAGEVEVTEAGGRGKGGRGLANVYRFVHLGKGVILTPFVEERVSSESERVSSDPLKGVTGDTPPQEPKEQNLLSATPTEWSSEPTKRTQTLAPSTFPITPRLRDWWATKHRPDIDLSAETERFLDWHRVNGKKRVDWTRAWQNWMSRAADRQPPRLVTNPAREVHPR